ncbi:hypothetical protein FMN63_20320 [Stappia sp. BW2]|uniref:hypothetical protein n=1 Tax=Stappia sp. BW2 TaxID=2592622 RepID=UPI0011DE5FE5|nr:hypothetical protein [Stappia sp. BW2]TYC64806.1 hypothetical protein FMN63_20320 [Stappia sp. BW2]
MADFEDLTGWREELQAYYGEGGQEAVDYIYRHDPEVFLVSTRLSQVQHFAELLLKDPELRDATAQQMEWLKVVDANGGAVGRGDPDWDNRPLEAHILMGDFYEWYCLKSGYPHEARHLYSFGMFTACDVLAGKYESVRSKACVELLLDSDYIEQDEGGL